MSVSFCRQLLSEIKATLALTFRQELLTDPLSACCALLCITRARLPGSEMPPVIYAVVEERRDIATSSQSYGEHRYSADEDAQEINSTSRMIVCRIPSSVISLPVRAHPAVL